MTEFPFHTNSICYPKSMEVDLQGSVILCSDPIIHAQIQKVLSQGSTSFTLTMLFWFFGFLFVFLGKRGSKCHSKRAIMAFRWRADDGSTLNAGLNGASLAR